MGDLDLLFFSRGRGRGHAIPALRIVEELRARKDASVRFVSYATGAATFIESGHRVIDLRLPERAAAANVFPLAVDCIRRFQPRAVVAHEEFGVPAAARLCGLPVLFLTDWFVEPDSFYMEALEDADEVLFLDERGVFEEPSFLSGKVIYTGPVMRPFQYRLADRARARAELGLASDSLVISVIVPPGRRIEKVAPIFDVLMRAFCSLANRSKTLVWLAGEDHRLLAERTAGMDGVMVKPDDTPFDRLMVASDLAITKGNRNIVLELAALGVPSISISHGLNPIDDMRTAQISSNRTLHADGLNSATLADHIRGLLARPPDCGLAFSDGAGNAAKRLAAFF